jgi:hypothetical protein
MLIAEIEGMKKQITDQKEVINMLINRVKTLEELMNTAQVDITMIKSTAKEDEHGMPDDNEDMVFESGQGNSNGSSPAKDSSDKRGDPKPKHASLTGEIAKAIEIGDQAASRHARSQSDSTQANISDVGVESIDGETVMALDKQENMVQMDMSGEKELFSEVIQTPGPWQEVTNKKDSRLRNAGNNLKVTVQGKHVFGNAKRVVHSNNKDHAPLILGAKHEASTVLYLKNLYT